MDLITESKQEVIKRAWTAFDTEVFKWENYKKFVGENGWMFYKKVPIAILKEREPEFEWHIAAPNSIVRPCTLKGIENNEGWTSTNEFADINLEKEETLIIGINRATGVYELHLAKPGDERFIFQKWSHYREAFYPKLLHK